MAPSASSVATLLPLTVHRVSPLILDMALLILLWICLSSEPNFLLPGSASDSRTGLRAIWEVLGDVWSIQDTEHGGNHYLCKGPPDEEDYNEMGWGTLECLVNLEKKDIGKEDLERENME